MRRLLIIGKSENEIADIKQGCSMSFVIDVAEHLNQEAFLDSDYSAILMLLDDAPEQYLFEIQQFHLKPLPTTAPIIIATRNSDPLYIRQAIRRGALDYVDLNTHYFLINNRIRNIMKLSQSSSAHEEAINRLLFYRCIGAAMMIEVSPDESMVQAIAVNNEFYDTVGIPKDFYANHTNLLDTTVPEELDDIKNAIHLARTKGAGECTYSNPAEHRTFRGTYHLITTDVDTGTSTMLLTLEDVTERVMEHTIHMSMMRLPGMTLFTYDPETDTVLFQRTTKKGKKTTVSRSHVTDPDKQKSLHRNASCFSSGPSVRHLPAK